MQYMSIWEQDAWDGGKVEGKVEKELEIVKRLLQNGVDINVIASSTDMPIEEIKKLANEIPLTQSIQL